ncbi:hypothetical protein [Sporosarcina obsidiansis]|uniref:hypothetical protein n=1 Tax=Sporosarcina obsidiansis TaxID=2660748 RepID=UPI00129A3D54|nr:hypothetical protein [Sporosarcina obsidiansis]
MTSRKFRPCSGCDSSPVQNRRSKCYDERQIIHIVTDFIIGTPVVITLIDSKDTKMVGYFLDFNRKNRAIHFQPFGDPAVQEIALADICTIKYSSY